MRGHSGYSHDLRSINVSNLNCALFLYELLLIHSDKHVLVSQLMNDGNYDILYKMRLITTPEDYVHQLKSFALKFCAGGDESALKRGTRKKRAFRDLISVHEADSICKNIDSLRFDDQVTKTHLMLTGIDLS